MFIRHHIHSIMSTRDAMLKIEDIIEDAKKWDESFIICDHGSIASWITLYNLCKKENIKPIFGVEAYINQQRDYLFELVEKINSMKDIDKEEKIKLQEERDKVKKYDHIILIAKNKTGFHNIIELANLGYVKGFYGKPTITYDELIKYKEGVIVTTACLGSTLNKYIQKKDFTSAEKHLNFLKENFDNDIYIEVQANSIPEQIISNKELIKLSKKMDIPMLIGMDSHYLDIEAKDTHQDLLLLQNKQKKSDIGLTDITITFENSKGEVKKKKVAPDKEFRKGILASEVKIGDEIKKEKVIDVKEVNRVWSFSGDSPYLSEFDLNDYIKENHKELIDYVDEIFDNNYHLYDKIDNIEIDTEIKLPIFEDEEKILVEKVKEGLREKKLTKKRKYIERAKHELNVIKKNGFASYFLILADFVKYAKTKSIPLGSGRGSGVSSLVAYLLGIHRIDPLDPRWGEMPFTRFLSLGKLSNKIIIYDEGGNKKEFISQDLVKIRRDKKEIIIEAQNLIEGDEFIKVEKRFDL